MKWTIFSTEATNEQYNNAANVGKIAAAWSTKGASFVFICLYLLPFVSLECKWIEHMQ